jgi:hypothetical protein
MITETCESGDQLDASGRCILQCCVKMEVCRHLWSAALSAVASAYAGGLIEESCHINRQSMVELILSL